jgi:hypothetical protein
VFSKGPSESEKDDTLAAGPVLFGKDELPLGVPPLARHVYGLTGNAYGKARRADRVKKTLDDIAFDNLVPRFRPMSDLALYQMDGAALVHRRGSRVELGDHELGQLKRLLNTTYRLRPLGSVRSEITLLIQPS